MQIAQSVWVLKGNPPNVQLPPLSSVRSGWKWRRSELASLYDFATKTGLVRHEALHGGFFDCGLAKARHGRHRHPGYQTDQVHAADHGGYGRICQPVHE